MRIVNKNSNILNKNINNKFKVSSLKIRKNDIGKTKYFPSYSKEWRNIGYFYNKITIKDLPFTNVLLNKIIRSYFNLFFNSYDIEKISIKRRNRFLNKIYISRAEIKYTNSIAIITIYTLNKLNSIFKRHENLMDYLIRRKEWAQEWKRFFIPGKLYWDNKKKSFMKSKSYWIQKKVWIRKWPISLLNQFLRPNFINRMGFKFMHINNNEKNMYKKNVDIVPISHIKKFDSSFYDFSYNLKHKLDFYNKQLELFYLDIMKLRIQEIKEEYYSYLETIWNYNELNTSNILKLNKNGIFIFKLKKLLSRILKKKVELNIVNLKSHTYNTDFFAESLSLKLKKNRFNVIKSMINIINKNLINTYKENKYKALRKKDPNLFSNKFKDLSLISIIRNKNWDFFLKDIYSNEFTMAPYNNIINKDFNKIYNTIFRLIEFKNLAGIRLEVKGRLTKRYRADRSIYKLLWKGGLKNKDSSFRGLSSVVFRGNLKPNVTFSTFKNKRRIGAFAVKGWISGK